jgi:hypothetical protein
MPRWIPSDHQGPRQLTMPDHAIQVILRSLHFERMESHHARPLDRHPGTYDWIFDRSSYHVVCDACTQKPVARRCNCQRYGVGLQRQATKMKSWLETSNGVFWVQVKVGAGKSTFMKFLKDKEGTRKLLRVWGNGEVVVAAFFFWDAGSREERSLLGLLRGLLFQILEQYPELIEMTLPQRWAAAANSKTYSVPQPWALGELSAAMNSILGAPARKYRFCFLVDGLDECADDHRDLVNTINAWAELSAVKICVSSRPWNIFRNEYGTNSNLSIALHELTACDIDLYVSARFEALECGRLRKDDLDELGEIVRTRSEGVFIWVSLAVSNLRQGINEHDTMPVLRERVLGFPSGLHDFIQQIFDKIDPSYKKFTGRLLLAMLSLRGSVALLTIPFLEDRALDDPSFMDSSIDTVWSPKSAQEMHELLNQAIMCADKWCRDLLQPIKTSKAHENCLSIPGTVSGFGHRTIYEFVSRKAADGTLANMAGRGFEPRISCWYTLTRLSSYAEDTDSFIKVVEYALKLASSLEHGISSTPSGVRLADGVSKCLLAFDLVGIQIMGDSTDRHWTATLLRPRPMGLKAPNLAPVGHLHVSLISYVMSKGLALSELIDRLAESQLDLYSVEQKQFLLEASVMPSPTYYTTKYRQCRSSHPDGLLAIRNQRLMTKIIESGIDVNKPIRRVGSDCSYSVWQFYLLWLRAYFHQDPFQDPVQLPGLREKLPDLGRVVDIFRTFLQCGADSSAFICLKDSIQCHTCYLRNPLDEMSVGSILGEMRRAVYASETFDHSKAWSAVWLSTIDELSALLAQASARVSATHCSS